MMKKHAVEPGVRCNADRAQGVEFDQIIDISVLTKDDLPRKARVRFDGSYGPEIRWVHGRNLWALLELLNAGAAGVTPMNCPAPRWSSYISNLRALGLTIETIRERHGGAYPGIHGRYVLHSRVTVMEKVNAAAL